MVLCHHRKDVPKRLLRQNAVTASKRPAILRTMGRKRVNAMARFGRGLAVILVVAAVGSAVVVYLRWVHRQQRYNQLIEQVAAKHGVDKFLVKAVIHRESKFDPFAYGRAGEIGLMQVTEGAGWDWARATKRNDFGRDLLWNERANVEAGTWYLARAMRRWPDKPEEERVALALAEYNAGLGRVQNWLVNGRATTAEEFMNAITIPSVRAYIETVTDYYEQYKAEGRL